MKVPGRTGGAKPPALEGRRGKGQDQLSAVRLAAGDGPVPRHISGSPHLLPGTDARSRCLFDRRPAQLGAAAVRNRPGDGAAALVLLPGTGRLGQGCFRQSGVQWTVADSRHLDGPGCCAECICQAAAGLDGRGTRYHRCVGRLYPHRELCQYLCDPVLLCPGGPGDAEQGEVALCPHRRPACV